MDALLARLLDPGSPAVGYHVPALPGEQAPPVRAILQGAATGCVRAVGYDVACKYRRWWNRCVRRFMRLLTVCFEDDLVFACRNQAGSSLNLDKLPIFVGRWHARQHDSPCQRDNRRLLMTTQGLGMANGDAPEQINAHVRPHGAKLKYMSFGEFRNFLDDLVREGCIRVRTGRNPSAP
jgi:hypothetical protein